MARVRFDVGMDADILSPEENRRHLAEQFGAWERAALSGIKLMGLPSLQGSAVGGVLSLGNAAPRCGPDSSYIWSISRLVVTGLTAGATPDVVNFYLNDTRAGTGPIFWQLNGNQFGETFGRGQMPVFGGEILLCQSVGTFAATGVITVSGTAWQVPAEAVGKLL
jgi:hypothetical protein